MGKYDSVVKNLPRRESDESPAYRVRVDAEKAAVRTAMENLTAARLARRYVELRKEKNTAEAALSEVNLRVQATEEMMHAAFEDEGVESVRVDGRGVFSGDGISATIIDRAAFLAWIKAESLELLLTVHSGTLSTLMGERLLSGLPVADGVKVTTYKKTTLR